MLGFVNAPMMRRSRSSWRITPGDVSVAPMRETPERTRLVGNAAMSGFSIFSPFWRRTMEVWPAVTAGAMSSATVGETSAMFLVVTTMKSNGLMLSWVTSGIVLRTEKDVSRIHGC